MKLPFLHHKHSNASQFRKIYTCQDHTNCSSTFTVIEGKDENDVLSHLCYWSGHHPDITSSTSLINAPKRGIHPVIKVQIDQWIKDSNMKPTKILLRLENSDFVTTHQLPTVGQIRQYKSEINTSIGIDISTLSSFRDYINKFKVTMLFVVKVVI